MPSEYDLLIRNAMIVDGTGSPSYRGAVGIEKERVAAVGKEADVGKDAKTVIDAMGCIVSPGFIDVHNHGDMSIIYYPEAEGYLRQGITTFVGGNCGSSPGPYGDSVSNMFLSEVVSELGPDMYYPDSYLPRDQVNVKHRELFGWEIDWHTMGGFFKKLEAKGLSPNYVPLLGHGPIRYLVMGKDHRRKATKQEVEAMKPHVRQAMEDGCRGISVGRDYDSYYADLDELVALASVAAEYGGVYSSHSLRTGLRRARRPGEFPPVKINGLLEAIDVGRKAKIPVQISHLGSLYDVTPMGSPIMTEASAKATLKIVDDGIQEGLDVSFDMIPGIRGFGTSTGIWLAGGLLPWLKIAGTREQFAKALRMKQFREEIKETIWSGKYYSLNPNITPDWARGRLIMEHKDPAYANKTIEQIAQERGIDPLDALMDAIVTDPDAKTGSRGRDSPREDPVRGMWYSHPAAMVGVDTYALDTTWRQTSPPWNLPSENSFNGFASYFRRVVRESKFLSVEEAVKKVTSQSAAKFKLRDRGVLRPGAYADIVVMDLEHVTDRGEPLDPCRYPVGIEHVIVNGQIVIRNSAHTKARPGKILYRER